MLWKLAPIWKPRLNINAMEIDSGPWCRKTRLDGVINEINRQEMGIDVNTKNDWNKTTQCIVTWNGWRMKDVHKKYRSWLWSETNDIEEPLVKRIFNDLDCCNRKRWKFGCEVCKGCREENRVYLLVDVTKMVTK